MVSVSQSVADALAENRPVVALASTIISHGLPRPDNLPAARRFEAILTNQGVVPATVAVLDGQIKVGLSDDEVERVANDDLVKASVRDLPVLVSRKASGGTTAAAAAYIARLAGIRVFAGGGLGGVHRGAQRTYDESADLHTLAETPITVVTAGIKSILDIPATLERFESLSLTVLGYRTDEFPGFLTTTSGEKLDWRVDSPEDVADAMASSDSLQRKGAILVANPISPDKQLDPKLHESALKAALDAAEADGVTGKDVSPFLLSAMTELTGGLSLAVNLDIAAANIDLGGQIARAWTART